MIKKLATYIGEYKKPSLQAPIFVSLEVLLEVLIPFLMSLLIDRGIDVGDLGQIWRIGSLLVAAALVSMVFGILSGRSAAVASAGYAKNLRKALFRKIQAFSFSNIDRFSSASLVTRLTSDVSNVQNSFQLIIRVAVRAPVMLVFSLVMALGINARLAMVFVGAIPFLAVGLYLVFRHAHPIFKRVFRTYDRLNQVVQENVRGIRVVKSYGLEDFEKKKFMEVSESIYRDFSKAEKFLALNMPLMQTAMYTCSLLVSWFGARQIVSASMTTGELTGLFAYSMQILMSLMMVSMVFVMITISRTSAERIIEVLDEEANLKNPEEPVSEVKSGDISFQNVSFSYAGDKDKLCLFHVDLDIRAGETVGVIGGTGASKSSLVQLIPRLYDTTEGSITVGGVPVQNYDLKVLRDSVAMVLQKNVLFSGTIRENLRWGDENASDEELERVCKLAQADEFIREFPDGYDTYIEQGGSNVSGGQKQRLCIARALLKKPKILILDDSTSAVDMKTDARIRRAFAQEIPETTKIIIAQRVASIEKADKIVVLDGGKIDAVGRHEDLLKSNLIYKEVAQSQKKGVQGSAGTPGDSDE